MSKKTVTFTVDPIIWDRAKDKLGCSRSEFLEEQLRIAVNLDETEEIVLRKEITELQEEINVRESKLCKLREKRLKHEKLEDSTQKAMGTINRIYENLGYIGEDKLREVSKFNNISFMVLYEECVDHGMKITRYTAMP